ncbi:Lipase (class 3) [Carpediemonas membranifera]|uniref:Lipase (Class 3) n=1 Tax=Carpediemonas membranifera TaxID=201153 RepID=A0A8J6E3U4_9EUKA|nr:Lipase (class 3) [Carpediemonas membranifera]|eukprot:KAG9396026.1 Lipase (class 3) [Carpediemonas membranifera]
MNLLLAFALIACVLAAGTYNPAIAKRAMHLSCASYCDSDKAVNGWTCPVCKTIDDISFVRVVRNEKTEARGYVALEVDPKTSAKTIHVVFRGTDSNENWLEDAEAWQTEHKNWPGVKVHRGFSEVYLSISETMNGLVRQLLEQGGVSLVQVTGHSLGAALASLSATDLRISGIVGRDVPLHLYTFGEPRVGTKAYAEMVPRTVDQVFRVTHYADIVPHLPMENMLVEKYHHEPTEVWYNEPNTEYRVCDGSGEDPTCSDSKATHVMDFKKGFKDHTFYLDVDVWTCMHVCHKDP